MTSTSSLLPDISQDETLESMSILSDLDFSSSKQMPSRKKSLASRNFGRNRFGRGFGGVFFSLISKLF